MTPGCGKGLTALSAGILMLGMAAPTASAGETKGFAVSWFQPAMYFGDGDCPDGTNAAEDFKAIFEKEGFAPDAVKHLIDNPNSPEFAKAVINRGPHGENVCIDPTAVPDPGMKIVKGRFAYGFNLDGKTDDAGPPAPNTCAHEKFVSPDGEKGIDNQLYRVLGCQNGHRGKRGNDGFVLQYIMERMHSEGLRTYRVEIDGLDASKTDGDVEVGIHVGSRSTLVQNARGEVQSDTTRSVISADTRWHNVVHGKVHNGVITTDIFDLNLLGHPTWIPELHFRQARMRLEVQPDGSLKGTVGGYQDLTTMYYNTVKSGILFEVFNSGSCPAAYYAFKRAADGYPDPKTGECTAISTAFAIEGVPAFVVHPDAAKTSKTAEAAAAATTD